ncbi:MAG: phytoene/squalene synthase family protein [Deltaproteobacteria bacterium]|nr:phytoene/squalene synthase family protein [Deltaproteobacteria bacterium]
MSDTLPAPSAQRLDAAIAACRAVTRQHARTFSLAARVLPRPLQAACYATYAFCRRADDAVDCAPDAASARLALREARARLERAYASEGPGDPDLEVAALAWAQRAFRIPKAALDDLLTGMALDLEPVRLRTWAELQRYCILAAGVVGRALAPALGAPPQAREAAEALGVAMQLTNILRDIDEDLGRGRIYLAQDELVRAGLSHDALTAMRGGGGPTPALQAFLRSQIRRARQWYAQAERGVQLIPSFRARVCVRAMALLYRDILRSLERQDLDPFAGRARVSAPRKLWLLLCAVAGGRLDA